MAIGLWMGLAGDSLTFAGGVVLALDALGKKKEVDKIEQIKKTMASPRLAGIEWKVGGAQIEWKDGDAGKKIEAVFLSFSVQKAKWGCLILSLGFLLLVAARLAEIFSPH